MKSANRKLKFIAAIIFIAVIIFLNNINYLEFFKNKFSYFFYYPKIFVSRITFTVKDYIRFIFEINKSYNDKIILIDENNRLLKQISDLKELENENKSLRSILDLPLSREHSLLDGIVIGKDPYNFSDYLLINRGSESGVEKGMAVVDKNGFYIGKIIDVLKNTSGVLLIIDSRSAVAAIDQRTRVQGLIKNDRTIGLYFDMVLQDADVSVDDMIISVPTAENNTSFPVAKVVSVEKYPNKTFQKITISPMSDMKQIDRVFVILN